MYSIVERPIKDANRMSEKLIKVNIANRLYPIKINEADEAQVHEAAKMINSRVKTYFEQFNVKDKQDVLAMYALELATDNINLRQQPAIAGDPQIEQVVVSLENLLSDIQL
ncbi:MAG: cell division protein ZapA [Bacteroidia bacterium]|jgi:cell division protein ZapA (FtsZ GTPase activity inhibitor)|nr:cell division protein ZapA [Bacteroidia bacterium]MBP7260003.1 cell division protein ZapA [Bacteroidia bacterium]MBP9179710.1 cell division protein ZapA [Bacteroidia bacterium]MBP9723891.1 cell division protein ZapA [Bacteroidia bacterium]